MDETRKNASSQAYAWNWFALHAGQRLQLVNFWLVAVAFLASAFVQARANHLVAIAFGVSVTGVASSLAFMRLDMRTRQLVHVAEESLISFEEAQTTAGSDEVHALVKAARQAQQSRLDSYRLIIQGLQLVIAIVFAIAAFYSFT